jgi:hypothetical protein
MSGCDTLATIEVHWFDAESGEEMKDFHFPLNYKPEMKEIIRHRRLDYKGLAIGETKHYLVTKVIHDLLSDQSSRSRAFYHSLDVHIRPIEF